MSKQDEYLGHAAQTIYWRYEPRTLATNLSYSTLLTNGSVWRIDASISQHTRSKSIH
jgi:hypothetical protein